MALSESGHFLDVSDLEPPEPLVRALGAADHLVAGHYLHMRHRREPCLLYPNLEKRGFAHLTCPTGDGNFEVFIWRAGDSEAERLARSAATPFADGQ